MSFYFIIIFIIIQLSLLYLFIFHFEILFSSLNSFHLLFIHIFGFLIASPFLNPLCECANSLLFFIFSLFFHYHHYFPLDLYLIYIYCLLFLSSCYLKVLNPSFLNHLYFLLTNSIQFTSLCIKHMCHRLL